MANPLQSARDLFNRFQPILNTASQNLGAWGQVAQSPQLRQQYTQQVIQPQVQQAQRVIPQMVQNVGQKLQSFSVPYQAPPTNLPSWQKNIVNFAMPQGQVDLAKAQLEPIWQGIGQSLNLLGQGKSWGQRTTGEKVNDVMTALTVLPMARTGLKLVNKQMAKTILAAEPEILNNLMRIKNYASFNPNYQMGIFTSTKQTAQKVIPDIIKSKEMVRLETANPLTWLNTVGKFMEDKLVQAKNPTFNMMGGTVKKLGKMEPQASQINRYLTNAYKVFSGQKPEQVVANLAEDVAKKTNLPRDIVVKKAFFDKMAITHPEINKQRLFNFVKTLNIPDEIYQISREGRLNFFRKLESQAVNLVSTGKDWVKPQQNVITSFNALDPKELKYLLKIKKTSNKVFPISSGGAGNSSSNMLSQVPGIGARLPRSSEPKTIIPQDVNLRKDLEDFLNGKISDTMNMRPMYAKGVGGVKGKLPQPELSATTETKLPTQSLQNQKLPGGESTNGLGSPSSPPIIPPGANDPVQKIIQALKQAKPLEQKQAGIYAKIRSKQAGAIAGVGKNIPGEAGFRAQLGQLKGEMPKVQFESIRKQIGQPDIDSLFNKVEQTNLTPFEKVTAKSGLAKLLGAEGGSVPVRSELELLNQVFPPEFIQSVLAKRPFISRLFSGVTNMLNVPRAVMATADLSAPLRQGIFLVGRPKQFIPAFRDMFKYAVSEKSYQGLMKDIQARPTYQAMRQAKLAITDMGPLLGNREEAFMSNLAERIPIFGRIAKGSNRAYSGFLNKLRADTFDSLYKDALKLGITKERPQVVEDIAKFVNSATGRGSLGGLQRSAAVLNGAFFSPRLMASRINLLNPIYYARLDPFVRKEALKSLFTFAGTATTVLGLAKLGGADVGADPRSADFGKIKVGNTRYDILGGFQQYLRLSGQLITGQKINTQTGKISTLGEGFGTPTRKDILLSFFESKTSPVASFIIALTQGQDAVGNKFNLSTEVINRFIPMVVSDMYDLSKESGSPIGAIPGIFGTGVQTYGKTEMVTGKNQLGQPTSQVRPVLGLGETITEKLFGQQPLGSSSGTNVQTYYDQLLKLPKEQAAQQFDQIIKTNPDLAKKLVQVAKDRQAGVTIEDQVIKAKGVASGDRAEAVAGEFNKLKTNQEKAALWEHYVKVGIINVDIANQLNLLKREGKF